MKFSELSILETVDNAFVKGVFFLIFLSALVCTGFASASDARAQPN